MMPSITVPVLNDLSAFQIIMQGENVSEARWVLIETVAQMRARRWNHGCFSSGYRRMKHEAENDLLTALNASGSMNEIKQALRDYKQQFNDVQHRIRPGGNTSAFMRGIGLLASQSSFLEKVSGTDDELINLSAGKPEPEASVSISRSIHICIRNAMKKAGYHPGEGGMCYGIAWTALSACVRQGGQAYMERMQYLKQMDTPPLSSGDDIYQVYPFFDAVTVSMTNYISMSGYKKGIGSSGRQEVAFPGRLIGGHEADYLVPVVKHAFIAECTHERFIRFLQQTRKNNKRIPFGVMIKYPSHATGIGFDGNKWLAADHDNHYYTETTDLLYTFLGGQRNYHKDGKMIAAIEVVTGNGCFLNINSDALVINAKKSVSVSLVLNLALQYGAENAVTDCITVISQQAYSPKTLLEILACKDVDGTPGFCMALYNGYPEAITTFIQASATLVTTLYLTEKQKAKLLCKLLASKRTNGTPGFFMALQNGHHDAITAFVQESTAAIATLGLTEKQKAKLLCELLASKTADGTPGFFMTLQGGSSEAITAFINASAAAITALTLPEERKAELLCGLLVSKVADGTPGFFMALQDGSSEAITAFINASAAAITALALPEERKAELLCELLVSKTADGTTGFFYGFTKGAC